MGTLPSVTTALVLAISLALLIGALMGKSAALWLGWAIVTVAGAGIALIRTNWGREPPSVPE